jgi:hypothetical protein
MPLPVTNKNNSLAFISILFLEMFTAPPKGWLRGASGEARRPSARWDSTHSLYMSLREGPLSDTAPPEQFPIARGPHPVNRARMAPLMNVPVRIVRVPGTEAGPHS